MRAPPLPVPEGRRDRAARSMWRATDRSAGVGAGSALPEGPPLGEVPANGATWVEAPSDQELRPGDLGDGTVDLEVDDGGARPRARRVPVSFSAVVLLLTLTTGIGMAAGLMGGPLPWAPTVHGPGSGGAPGSTPVPPASPPGTSGTPPVHGANGSGPNGTGGNGTGPPSNGTGPGSNGSAPGSNGTGSSSGNGTSPSSNGSSPNTNGGSSGSGGNFSGPPGNLTTPNRTLTVYRNNLPWFPTDSRTWLAIGAGASLAGLALAVLYESYRPPPVLGNPWQGREGVGRSLRRRPRGVSPRRAIESAVAALRAELIRYGRSWGAGEDREVRERIIALYGSLLAAVGPGLGDLDRRTPREVEWLAVRYLGVRDSTAHELTWLFEEARYSTHRLPPSSVERAVNALARLVEDLQRRVWQL
jgi:hypothetical protein